MATTIQHNPVLLPQEDEDIALANYLTSSLRLNQSSQRIHPQRVRVSSNASNHTPPRKSSARPQNDYSRKVERRSSIESTTSGLSIQSDMSMATKLSLSKRLRKVFSMNNLKSASSVSLQQDSSDTNDKPKSSLRRRSIASLSSLFQKSPTITPQPSSSSSTSASRRHSSGDLRQFKQKEEHKKRPDLRVDTTEPSYTRKSGLKVRSSNPINSAPDSPNSAISTRSFTRLPPPQQRNFIHEPGLPSPTPSTASSHEDYLTKKPTVVGLQYGIGLHSSPKLKPASSSTSSLHHHHHHPGRRVQFCTTIQVHETFAATDYDRRCDTSATCQKLTPISAMKIKQELNEYKLTEMDVHVESRQYTHFFL
ncbi:hypothetical protein A0J61_02086 [Choanephora cucurbitarum]|uniref:Bud neck involved protein n=1 Tax=Choanephora cucurbitarum TaxID=101091 RepID=A0A1C7NLC3_9FUNG|nr:hypothetical protein A0J61_02086 [Choanephora cucurbitarum]